MAFVRGLGSYVLAAVAGSAGMTLFGQITKHYGSCTALCDPSFSAITGAITGLVALHMIRSRDR